MLRVSSKFNSYYKEYIPKQHLRKDMAVSTLPGTLSQSAENYNFFFNPNVCHVCKTYKKILQSCFGCNMIYYCSEEHRILHRPQHKDVCEVIIYLSKYMNVRNTGSMTLEEWVKLKKNNVQYIKMMLGRVLEPYEKQMFLFPKSCLVCHTQENPCAPCRGCFSVNRCSNHNSVFGEHACSELRHCLEVHKFNMYINNRNKRLFTRFLSLDTDTLGDMESFIIYYRRNNGTTTPNWTHNDTLLSDEFSGPLTMLYAMHRAHLFKLTNDMFVVHIVTETSMDKRALSAWEINLHTFLRQAMLLIEVIGPELKNEYCLLDTCKGCTHHENKYQYHCHPFLYHDYAFKG